MIAAAPNRLYGLRGFGVPRGSRIYRPMRGLGAVNTTGLVSKAAGTGATAGASALGLGAAAGPIGAAVGAVVSIIGALWSAHDARVKGATAENTIVASALTAFQQSLTAIFQAANSGQITAAQAITLCNQLWQQSQSAFLQGVGPAGTADNSSGGNNCFGAGGYSSNQLMTKQCTSSCTVGCCLLCNIIAPTVATYGYGGIPGGSAQQAFGQNPGPSTQWFTPPNTCNVPPVSGDSFGMSNQAGYSLTYTAPKTSAGTGSGIVSTGTTFLSELEDTTIEGIPLLVIAGAAALLAFAI